MNFSLLPFITPGGTGNEIPAPPQPQPQPQPADSVNSEPLLHSANAFMPARLCAVGTWRTHIVQVAACLSS